MPRYCYYYYYYYYCCYCCYYCYCLEHDSFSNTLTLTHCCCPYQYETNTRHDTTSQVGSKTHRDTTGSSSHAQSKAIDSV